MVRLLELSPKTGGVTNDHGLFDDEAAAQTRATALQAAHAKSRTPRPWPTYRIVAES
jgi:hypothetical protein